MKQMQEKSYPLRGTFCNQQQALFIASGSLLFANMRHFKVVLSHKPAVCPILQRSFALVVSGASLLLQLFVVRSKRGTKDAACSSSRDGGQESQPDTTAMSSLIFDPVED